MPPSQAQREGGPIRAPENTTTKSEVEYLAPPPGGWVTVDDNDTSPDSTSPKKSAVFVVSPVSGNGGFIKTYD